MAGLLNLEVPAIAHPLSVMVLDVALRSPLGVSEEQPDVCVCVLFLPPLRMLLLSSGVVTLDGAVLAWASGVYVLPLGPVVCHRSPWMVWVWYSDWGLPSPRSELPWIALLGLAKSVAGTARRIRCCMLFAIGFPAPVTGRAEWDGPSLDWVPSPPPLRLP